MYDEYPIVYLCIVYVSRDVTLISIAKIESKH